MKRPTLLLAVLAFVAVTTAASRAQIPQPTPAPDPHVYSDPGMNFTAPPDAYLAGRRYIPPAQLGQDLQPVAVWLLHPGQEDMRTIQLSMEAFPNAPDQWEAQFESQTHGGGGNGVLIRNKTPMALLNGMPATFVEVTSGSGFTSKKEFAVVWADGQRGIVLSLTARVGDVTAEQAKALLKNVTAVRYPMDRS
jgi:hypothetical protein